MRNFIPFHTLIMHGVAPGYTVEKVLALRCASSIKSISLHNHDLLRSLRLRELHLAADMTDGNLATVKREVEALNRAMLGGDRAELERLTAQELIYGHANARLENQSEFIAALTRTKSGFSAIEASDQEVTLVDNVAVVHHLLTRTRADGSASSMKELQVWMLRNAQWKLVARQSVRV